MITTIDDYLKYFESVRKRSIMYFNVLPPEQIDWALREGEFTCGDIIRHLGASELMWANAVTRGDWRYPGHERERGADLAGALAMLDECHQQAMAMLRTLSDADLQGQCAGLGGTRPLKIWRVLMMTAEHEVHHRSQFATYLTLMGVEPPQIFGMKLEDVIARGPG
jgi:uncharacterized damage-inducible protein DinB